jgi:imidazolonepropionase-like amidohydrolase
MLTSLLLGIATRCLGRLTVPVAAGATVALLALTTIGQAHTQERPVAFVGVHVIPMDREQVVQNQTVVVRDGRIVAMGPARQTEVPDGATEIAARGMFLMPGLAEMHAHVPSPRQEEVLGAGYTERVLFLYVASGITTIRGMLGDPSHLEVREHLRRGDVLGPTLYTYGPSFNGNSAPRPETAIAMVRNQAAAGYDFLKIHPGPSRATFDALAQTAGEVEIRFAGHVPADVGLERAIEARFASIDHLDGYVEALAAGRTEPGTQSGFFGSNLVDAVDESRLPALARATREAGVWNVPTQILMAGFGGGDDPDAAGQRPEMQYMPPQVVAQWVRTKRNFQQQDGYSREQIQRFVELRGRIIKTLHEVGAGLLLGSDAPQVMNVPGFSALAELEAIVAAGLTPYEALETGTKNVAVYFDTIDESGTVEAGKVADLILLSANPLADVRNVSNRVGVMVRGRWLPEAEIQRRLAEIAAVYAGN